MSEVIDLETGRNFINQQIAREIDEEHDFSSLVINTSLDAIIAFDRNFRYTVFNPAAEKFHGVRREGVIGRCMFDVFPFSQDPKLKSQVKETLHGRSEVGETMRVHPDGEIEYTRVSRIPLRDEFGEVVGGLVILRDITYERKLERIVRSRNDPATECR